MVYMKLNDELFTLKYNLSSKSKFLKLDKMFVESNIENITSVYKTIIKNNFNSLQNTLHVYIFGVEIELCTNNDRIVNNFDSIYYFIYHTILLGIHKYAKSNCRRVVLYNEDSGEFEKVTLENKVFDDIDQMNDIIQSYSKCRGYGGLNLKINNEIYLF